MQSHERKIDPMPEGLRALKREPLKLSARTAEIFATVKARHVKRAATPLDIEESR